MYAAETYADATYADAPSAPGTGHGGYRSMLAFWMGGASAGAGGLTVPNVVGLTEADGTTVLTTAGFTVAVAQASSSSVPAGTVISQSPAAGSFSSPGATVTITVSTGDAVATDPTLIARPNVHVRGLQGKRKKGEPAPEPLPADITNMPDAPAPTRGLDLGLVPDWTSPTAPLAPSAPPPPASLKPAVAPAPPPPKPVDPAAARLAKVVAAEDKVAAVAAKASAKVARDEAAAAEAETAAYLATPEVEGSVALMESVLKTIEPRIEALVAKMNRMESEIAMLQKENRALKNFVRAREIANRLLDD